MAKQRLGGDRRGSDRAPASRSWPCRPSRRSSCRAPGPPAAAPCRSPTPPAAARAARDLARIRSHTWSSPARSVAAGAADEVRMQAEPCRHRPGACIGNLEGRPSDPAPIMRSSAARDSPRASGQGAARTPTLRPPCPPPARSTHVASPGRGSRAAPATVALELMDRALKGEAGVGDPVGERHQREARRFARVALREEARRGRPQQVLPAKAQQRDAAADLRAQIQLQRTVAQSHELGLSSHR